MQRDEPLTEQELKDLTAVSGGRVAIESIEVTNLSGAEPFIQINGTRVPNDLVHTFAWYQEDLPII